MRAVDLKANITLRISELERERARLSDWLDSPEGEAASYTERRDQLKYLEIIARSLEINRDLLTFFVDFLC